MRFVLVYLITHWITTSFQAFVIYCFFQLLLGYLGGERSLLILVQGRQPKASPFPVNVVQRELDVSDPYTFLFLKRGILRMCLIAFSKMSVLKFSENTFKSSHYWQSRHLH
jgi:Organic solute transporter Ostalpha